MTDAPSRGAFETVERFDRLEDADPSNETGPLEAPRDQRDAVTILERLRALEAFSAA